MLKYTKKVKLEKMGRHPMSISVTDNLNVKIVELITTKMIALNLERVVVLILSKTEKNGMMLLLLNRVSR